MPGAHAQYIGCAQDRRDIDMRACSASPGALPFSALAQRVAWPCIRGALHGYDIGLYTRIGVVCGVS